MNIRCPPNILLPLTMNGIIGNMKCEGLLPLNRVVSV
jgi:hypothetical protein